MTVKEPSEVSEETILDIPDDLYAWLQEEAKRCNQSIDELIIDILETRQLFEEGLT